MTIAEPFATWAVEVTDASPDGRVRAVDFDSPLLARRTRALVWVPPSWRAGNPMPVVYHLHGTVATTLPPAAARLTDALARRGRTVPFVLRRPDRGVVTPSTMRFDETLDDHEFLLVAPDAGAPPWCLACNWVDGADGQGVAAERHLYEELFPLVEELFGTRRDRAGRAIIGHSMGGGGAMIQAFRHPDRFAFVGCSSGTLSVLDDRTSRSGIRWLIYNRTQGFRPIPFDRVRYRNINLVDLAANVVGAGLEIVVVVGDGTDTGERRPDGRGVTVDEDRRMERNLRRNNDAIVPRLAAAGVPLSYIRRSGIHTIGASTFRRHLLPRLNAAFRAPLPDPTEFSYRNADARFEVWGWRFRAERERPELLQVVRATTDGRSVSVAGSGDVDVVTPPAFAPGAHVVVAVTGAGDATPSTERVCAGDDGRVAFRLRLRGPETVTATIS